jgi:hypothetical protein
MSNSKLTKVLLGFLLVQFVLGMLANLYSQIPNPAYEVFQRVGFISLHAIVGTILLVLSVVLLVHSRKAPGFGPALGGFIDILLAYIFGEAYVFTRMNIFSLLMAIAFIGAMMAYTHLAFSRLKT